LHNREDNANERLNNLLQDNQLIVNDLFPDLVGLHLHSLDWIILQDEHGGENLVLGVHVNILWLGLYDIILQFFDQLEHEDG
jgi:hypothetical protein